MNGSPVIREEFLRPTAELVAGAGVGSDLLDCVAVAYPVEVGTPNIGVDDGEAPAAGGDLTDE